VRGRQGRRESAETVKARLFCKERHHKPRYPIGSSAFRLILSEPCI
jgi:hypothetical protein